MKLQKAIRTVAAVGVGAAMLGASALGALAAADLSSYPAPFIQNGTFNGQIVVGTAASTSDVIGAIGIATSLQAAAVKEVPVGSSGSGNQTVVTGGAQVMSGSNYLNYGEYLNNTKSFFDQNDLSALQTTSVTGEDGVTYNMQFRVNSPGSQVKFGTYGTQVDPVMYVDFNSASYSDVIQFPSAVPLQTLAGKAVTLFGRDYTVGSVATLTNTTKLTLYDAGIDKTFNAGDQVTVNVGGTSFDVQVMGVTSGTPSQAAVSINGDQQQVQAGHTYTFNGQSVYVKQVIAYSQLSSAGTNGAVELFLGSNKITIENGAPVTVGQDDTVIPGTLATFASGGGKTTSITVKVTPSQDSVYGLKAGDSYTDPVFKELKWQFTGVSPDLMDSGRGVISVTPSGTNQLNLQWTNSFGTEYSAPFVQATAAANSSFAWGTGSHQDYALSKNWNSVLGTATGTKDTFKLYQNERFFVTNNQYSRMLQVQSIDTYNNKVTFSDVGSGETFKASSVGTLSSLSDTGNYTGGAVNSSLQVAQLTVDGMNYDFAMVPGSPAYIVSTATSTGQPTANVITQKGAEVAFNPSFASASATGNAMLLNVTEGGQYTQDKAGAGAGSIALYVNRQGYAPSSGKAFVSVAPVATGSLGSGTEQSNSDLTDYVDSWGTFVQVNTNSNSGWAKLYFPDRAMRANVYLAPQSAGTTVTGGEGSTMSQQVQKINVGAAVLDSEADSMVGHANLLVVGGPCANTVAAALMGNPAAGHCADGFEPGKGMIKVFDNNGYESILVAGYESAETRLASQVLANYQDHKAELQGTEVIVEQTSANTVSITAPAVSSGNATGNSTA